MSTSDWKQQCKRNWKNPYHWLGGLVLGLLVSGWILEANGRDGEWAFMTAACLVLIPLVLAWLLLALGVAVGVLGDILDCIFGPRR